MGKKAGMGNKVGMGNKSKGSGLVAGLKKGMGMESTSETTKGASGYTPSRKIRKMREKTERAERRAAAEMARVEAERLAKEQMERENRESEARVQAIAQASSQEQLEAMLFRDDASDIIAAVLNGQAETERGEGPVVESGFGGYEKTEKTDGSFGGGSGRGSRGGSGLSSRSYHDKECEILTFMYVMGRAWKLLDGSEIKQVLAKISKDGDYWTRPEILMDERICACGLSGLIQHHQVPEAVLQRMGENLATVMYDLFGKSKVAELQKRISEGGI